ncbi:hypothetical protein Pcinc_000290 [Petrolisthes cinctipes]|uniref:Endonuclease/exonuclease/phosphatase domain-containing protein n=1 Tax=Petrolisthes cinctipes TaxID=88211 RepID=A0AAE1L4J5_PETCI|nr:hypothetical protein Pcinc_000290 [Petrolisthes cinctipes]
MDTILLCVCYHPQWQGSDPINYIYGNLDSLLLQHSCKHFIMLGDLNQHLVERSFQELLTDYGLTNYVDIPTHISGPRHHRPSRGSDHLSSSRYGGLLRPHSCVHHHHIC